MVISTYDVGDGVRALATFKNFAGNPADPTVIGFKLLDPSGAITMPPVSRTSTGNYYADFVISDVPGMWVYRWIGSGAVTAAEEGKFAVRQSAFSL